MTEGSATLGDFDLLDHEPEERAAAGLFLAFQYPVEIPGVGNMTFLRTAVNAQRKARGEAEIGFQQISELLPVAGIDFVAPLPAEVQRITVYFAGVPVGANSPEGGRTLIRFFVSPEGMRTIANSGLQPIAP